MKLKWKRLAALLLAAILMLSLTGLNAEEAISEDAASVNELEIENDDFAVADVFEGSELKFDDGFELNLSDDSLDLVGDPAPEVEDIATSEPADVAQEESNASNTITLGVKETYTISTKGLGKNLTFTSSKPKVASVTAKGVVKGLKKGAAEITVMSGTKEKKKITVKVIAAPAKVTLSTKTATLGIKESVTVTAKLPKNSHATLTWTSKNRDIATVTKAGKITGKKAGTTTITVKTHNGKKATLKVTVAKAPASIALNKTSTELAIGDNLKLKPILPKGTASATLTWKSSNSRVATVSKTGKVTPVNIGTANITVATFNNKKASCTVTVRALYADKYSISMNAGGTETITITSLVYGELYWYNSNTSVVSCQWGNWYGDNIDLYIKGLQGGTATVTVKNVETGESIEIDVTVYAPEPTPTPTPTPDTTILLPDTPLIVGDYSPYSGAKLKEYEITNISYSTRLSKVDNTVTAYIYFAGNKLYDSRGSGQSSMVEIGYKLYDSSGAVVDSGIAFGPSVAMGEAWTSESCYKIIFNLSVGKEYTLKILSTN